MTIWDEIQVKIVGIQILPRKRHIPRSDCKINAMTLNVYVKLYKTVINFNMN